MLVRDTMTPNPITIAPDTAVPEAQRIMRERKVRRLPVLDGSGKLVGIVSENDLRHASPSPATTLDVWEINALVAKIKVSQIMTRNVITVTEETSLEEAARLMADHRVSGLPVMHSDRVVGMITETDIFKAFLELMGARRPGVRVTASVANTKGVLARLASAVASAGGDIVGIGFQEIKGPDGPQWEATIKVQDVTKDQLVAAIKPHVTAILDTRVS